MNSLQLPILIDLEKRMMMVMVRMRKMKEEEENSFSILRQSRLARVVGG
jgi:hypothetical protein